MAVQKHYFLELGTAKKQLVIFNKVPDLAQSNAGFPKAVIE